MRAKCILTALAIAVALAASPVSAENAEQKAMAQQIARGLKQSGQLQDYRVGVKYEDGVAWLMGSVTSKEQERTALKLTRKMDGVSHVVSKLEITGSQAPAASSDLSDDFAESLQLASMQASKKQTRTNNNRQSNQPARMRPNPRQQMNGQRFARRGSQMPLPAARVGQQGRGGMQQGRAPMGRTIPANYTAGAPGMGPMPGGGMPGHVAGGGVQGASYGQGNMPGYAWPSYAAQSNYAAVTYPTQYSASAWPYIGPFHPYPQVPLGWRRVSLEWDDGWWFLDFNDTRNH